MACNSAWPLQFLLLVSAPAHAQFTAQVLIEPTVDPVSVYAAVQTLSGPTAGVKRGGFENGPSDRARYHEPAGAAGGIDGTVFVAHPNHPLTLNHIIYFVLGVGLLRVGFSRLQDVKPEAES